MIVKEHHEQLSPNDEICEAHFAECRAHPIPAFTEFYFVVTHDNQYLNICATHFHEIVTLQ